MPESQRRGKRAKPEYVERVQKACLEAVPAPLDTKLITVDVWFRAPYLDRADVDNAACPLLDAMKGIVYGDDRQVHSLRISCLSEEEGFGLMAKPNSSFDHFDRLMRQNPPVFLVNIFDGWYPTSFW